MLEQNLAEARDFEERRHETHDNYSGGWQFNWPVGTRRTVLSQDPETGAMSFLLEFPAGYVRGEERGYTDRGECRFEWHSCHEEIFCLIGEIRFGDYYTLDAPAFLNHPPGWVHPADQYTDTGCVLLIRNSGPVDFVYEPVPAGWDGQEYVVPQHQTGTEPAGVSTQSLDLAPTDGEVRADSLYTWPDGLVTELVSYPAGWMGEAGKGRPEMVFVLEGDLAVGDTPLSAWGYSSHLADQTSVLSTRDGARAIRWAK